MIALRKAMVPFTAVYFVSPRSMASCAATLTWSGVSKSGSPIAMSTMSRPAAFNSRTRADAAVVGEILMRETRAAGTKVITIVVLELRMALISVFHVGFPAHAAGEEELAEFVMGDVRRPAVPDHLAETQDDGPLRNRHGLLGVLLD